jgi:hypothetical protein
MHEVADTDLPEEAGVVDDATALDAAVGCSMRSGGVRCVDRRHV